MSQTNTFPKLHNAAWPGVVQSPSSAAMSVVVPPVPPVPLPAAVSCSAMFVGAAFEPLAVMPNVTDAPAANAPFQSAFVNESVTEQFRSAQR